MNADKSKLDPQITQITQISVMVLASTEQLGRRAGGELGQHGDRIVRGRITVCG
jgi:hypothetical protein